jgi:hypothetical protein
LRPRTDDGVKKAEFAAQRRKIARIGPQRGRAFRPGSDYFDPNRGIVTPIDSPARRCPNNIKIDD